MPQSRFYLRGTKAEAEAIFTAWDAAFEEDGAPVGTTEIDEAADIHEISVYFDDAEGKDRRPDVTSALPDEWRERLQHETIPDTDWMKIVLADLKPVRAGRFVVHGAHDRGVVRANDLSVEIEAGQAFGTGHHGTTAGCLEMIHRIVRRRRPRNALDLGTGTAVLAIGVAKLARVPVLATDIDPVAVDVARQNVEANRVAGLVEVVVATGMAGPAIRSGAPYDLIVANILAGPLAKLAPAVARNLAFDGDLILSGILVRQRNAVLAAYRDQYLYHHETIRNGDWVTLHLARR
ncbi:50S ribosomal protein L11 methyltransferase [Aureimonas psammosilenae]|uniref:50S ribosomal protein L11 methyltransferase n=1 Tax=Aureimonas psammosilenae TaxID=2495496 RepID=UPI001260A47E|nr:50S ribosomal protein L11 methyltransferase [Aureimonas psammosilenae]